MSVVGPLDVADVRPQAVPERVEHAPVFRTTGEVDALVEVAREVVEVAFDVAVARLLRLTTAPPVERVVDLVASANANRVE